MPTTHKSSDIPGDTVLRKALVFERALHRWDKWLDSVAYGRKVLRFQQSHPALEEMISVAKKALTEMKFPACTLLEVYWLCCVFVDYKTEGGFVFDRLVLPDWFPPPFKREGWAFDIKGKRIYPPEVWNDADLEFWVQRDPVVRLFPSHTEGPDGRIRRIGPSEPSTIRAPIRESYLNSGFILVLPANHPVRKYIKKGRPIKIKADGETILE